MLLALYNRAEDYDHAGSGECDPCVPQASAVEHGQADAEAKARRRRAKVLAGVARLTVRTWGRRLVEVVLVGDAGKVRRNAGAAAAAILRDLGEDAERPGHLDRGRRIANELGGDDRLRRHAGLDPGDERGERIETVGAGPAGAVVHPGHHEQPGVALGPPQPRVAVLVEACPLEPIAAVCDQRVEVVDAALRWDQRV